MSAFLDTNILVHAWSNGAKAATAQRCVTPAACIGVQTLNEFALTARRRLGKSMVDIRSALTTIRALVQPPIPLTLQIHEQGLFITERYQLAIYDSMLLAAALHARCDTFWSEDMHDGLVIDGRLTIRNPFA